MKQGRRAQKFIFRGHHAHHCAGRGRGTGVPLMPFLFFLGQSPALVSVQQQLIDGEHLFAYLDDIYVVSEPGRVRTVIALLENALWQSAGISIHQGKTKIWNRAGVEPPGCHFGFVSSSTRHQNLGHSAWAPEFVRAHLERIGQEHQILLDRIPLIQDVQCAWLLLLHRASARARVVEPGSTRNFCEVHDASLWKCLEAILQMPLEGAEVKSIGSLPMVLGGIGLQSAMRTSTPAYWASWCDSLAMIRRRQPIVAAHWWSNWKAILRHHSFWQQRMREGSWKESWGLNHPRGRRCRMGLNFRSEIQKM